MGGHPSLWTLRLCVFFLIFQSRQCLGCMEEDRVALLDLKASSGGRFRSWVDNKTSDCCRWDGVDCSPATGRVSELGLNAVGAYFNASMFLPFKDLEYLTIFCSNVSVFEHQGFEKLSQLKNLESLQLSECSLKSNILASLSELTSLKELNLSRNHIGEGSSAEISQGFKKLSKLNKLEYLYLKDNVLKRDILTYFSGLTSLKILDLSGNLLGEGSLSAILQGFLKLSNLQKLEKLNLSDNRLKSNVLTCLSELKSLKQLDLDHNFMGKDEVLDGLSQGIKKLAKLNNLEYLNLAYNDLSNKAIPHFAEFTSIILLNGNRITEISGVRQDGDIRRAP